MNVQRSECVKLRAASLLGQIHTETHMQSWICIDYRAERSECALKPNAYEVKSTPLSTTDCTEESLCEAGQEISPFACSTEQEV